MEIDIYVSEKELANAFDLQSQDNLSDEPNIAVRININELVKSFELQSHVNKELQEGIKDYMHRLKCFLD